MSIITISLDNIFYNAANMVKATRWEQILPYPEKRTKDWGDIKVTAVYKSLNQVGQINPLLVYPLHHPDNPEGFYEVALGHQRLASMRALGWTECTVVVVNERAEIPPAVDKHYIQHVWDDETRTYVKKQ